ERSGLVGSYVVHAPDHIDLVCRQRAADAEAGAWCRQTSARRVGSVEWRPRWCRGTNGHDGLGSILLYRSEHSTACILSTDHEDARLCAAKSSGYAVISSRG